MKHRTAISRKAPSVPMRWLASGSRIIGRALDYGSGRGYDAKHYAMESYDPHYSPVMPPGLFDTITCNYVLNVVESHEERALIVKDIRTRLAPGGRGYITVRNDSKALNGRTSKGTWQGLVTLPLPIIRKCAGHITYEVAA
jgi:hypothetical protein